MMKFRLIYLLVILGLNLGCKNKDETKLKSDEDVPTNTKTPSYSLRSIRTDKACYTTNEEVTFTFDNSAVPSTLKVRYKYLNKVIDEAPVTSNTWKWTPPSTDFKGYIAEVYSVIDNKETIYSTIAIDVSSTWTKFPRYGFLSEYGQLNENEMTGVIDKLNRYHINGLQFYDWLNKHHQPLPVVNNAPSAIWKDIINRDIYFNTVDRYISLAHSRNMKAMFYNLIYGAWENAERDGVDPKWYVYKDTNHGSRDFHPLSSPPFLSNIYLLDPSNQGWQNYIKNENKKVYKYLNFDGFHMDQLGGRGTKYRYDGSVLNLDLTYESFINTIKTDEPDKSIVMNAVAQYGQTGIAKSSTDFLYTEVWDPFNSYVDLANIIKANSTYSNNTKNTVLAAYMNYDLANNPGYFNTASVLFTNAVIFAFGGSHLELGEHMLAKEYFPNSNLQMKDDLKNSLVSYYDFLVSYQNVLRDGGTFNTVLVTTLDKKTNPQSWPTIQANVSVISKKIGNSQILHFINFKDSKTTNWRDNLGEQVLPTIVENAQFSVNTTGIVKNIWVASPDNLGGASRTINFNQTEGKVNFTLPELMYWSMVVIEY